MGAPEIAVIVSSYQRPEHLRRCLVSLTTQQDVDGRFEVIVTDDGSMDDTELVVAEFEHRADFPIKFTTHPHDGFQLSRCRNEGVAVSSAPYLLFTDGDCILPPDHLRCHLEFRRPGKLVAGDHYRFTEETSQRVTDDAIRSGVCFDWIPAKERRRLAGKALRAWGYQLLRLKMLPRLTGNNIGVWRADFERVNGFDENFVGWGFEDRDLQRRLEMVGVRCMSILSRTAVCHLWHPPAPSFSRNGVGTKNREYFERASISSRCQVGLAERILAMQAAPLELEDSAPILLPFSKAESRHSPDFGNAHRSKRQVA
jgi:glycosyltransferase involved in cell wall biosynthesis